MYLARTGQTALEYLLIIVVAILLVTAIFIWVDTAQEGITTEGDEQLDCFWNTIAGGAACGTPAAVCGDGNVDPGETCDPPDAVDSSQCSNPDDFCVGNRIVDYDDFGDCNSTCQCIQDPAPVPACLQGQCGAQCDDDGDCAAGFCQADCTCSACNFGDTRWCDTGLLGVCRDGIEACDGSGSWSGCNVIINPGDVEEEGCLCFDGLDNDCDGQTDEEDNDDWPRCQCMDLIDNDGDGDIDCEQSGDCGFEPYCAVAENLATCPNPCSDGFDNDGDGLIDANDPDCPPCGPGDVEEGCLCFDGLDNDCDGLIDADDDTGPGSHNCQCRNLLDDENSGTPDLTDCDDPVCSNELYCADAENLATCEDPCNDGFDNDADGAIDGADSDCSASVCGNDVQEPGEECDDLDDLDCPGECLVNCICSGVCGNGVQEWGEDCDGADDLICPDLCQGDCFCPAPYETGCDCFDGLDNDGDGLIDEQDNTGGPDHNNNCNCMNSITDDDEHHQPFEEDCENHHCSGDAPYCNAHEDDATDCGGDPCSDGFDNDGDGLIDGADPDCS